MNELPYYTMDLQYTGVAIPFRSILFPLCDLLIRFFFSLPRNNQIHPILPEGYKWQTRRDQSSGAVVTFEILDASLPPMYAATLIKIKDFFEAIRCSLLIECNGDYDDEEAHQQSFEATFRIVDVAWEYA